MAKVLVLLAVGLAIAAANQMDIIVRTIMPAPEDCSVKVENGDAVWIEHKGFWKEQQIDGSPQGEPLKFVVGKGRILRGK